MSQNKLDNYIKNLLDKQTIFDSTNSSFIVVDKDVNIIYLNDKSFVELYDEMQRPGDVLKCINAVQSEKGCGTSVHCPHCNLRNSVHKAISSKDIVNQEVVLTVENNIKLVLQETATPFEFDGKEYAAIFILDISNRKREQMFERVFFHDMKNLVGAMGSFIDILHQESNYDLLCEIKKINAQIMDELSLQQELIYAEKGILSHTFNNLGIDEILSHIEHSLSPMVVTKGKHLVIENHCGNETVSSDLNLLHRILLNMIKNAVEASGKSSDTITLSARVVKGNVQFAVHNNAVIPEHYRTNIFKFGTSSKGEGRGIGTYSMKLLGENYLKGKVWFESENNIGTTFYLALPIAE